MKTETSESSSLQYFFTSLATDFREYIPIVLKEKLAIATNEIKYI
jgi:hypothetical protein